MKARRFLRVALLLAATSLAGCAATADAVRTNDQASLEADHALAAQPKADPTAGSPAVAHVDTMYFGQTVYRRRRGDDFPPRADHILVRSPGEVDLHGFAALITKASGIPVALNIAKANGQTAAPATSPAAGPTAVGMNLPPLAPFPGPATASSSTMATQAVSSRTPT